MRFLPIAKAARCEHYGHDWFPPIEGTPPEYLPRVHQCLRCHAPSVVLPTEQCLATDHYLADHYDPDTGELVEVPWCPGGPM